jgi:hypothetical protein
MATFNTPDEDDPGYEAWLLQQGVPDSHRDIDRQKNEFVPTSPLRKTSGGKLEADPSFAKYLSDYQGKANDTKLMARLADAATTIGTANKQTPQDANFFKEIASDADEPVNNAMKTAAVGLNAAKIAQAGDLNAYKTAYEQNKDQLDRQNRLDVAKINAKAKTDVQDAKGTTVKPDKDADKSYKTGNSLIGAFDSIDRLENKYVQKVQPQGASVGDVPLVGGILQHGMRAIEGENNASDVNQFNNDVAPEVLHIAKTQTGRAAGPEIEFVQKKYAPSGSDTDASAAEKFEAWRNYNADLVKEKISDLRSAGQDDRADELENKLNQKMQSFTSKIRNKGKSPVAPTAPIAPPPDGGGVPQKPGPDGVLRYRWPDGKWRKNKPQ